MRTCCRRQGTASSILASVPPAGVSSPPLVPGWVIVDGLPMYHRSFPGGDKVERLVHVHGFGISGSYLEPTAARLASKTDRSCPTCRDGPQHPARSSAGPARVRRAPRSSYCDTVGIEQATFVGNSLGCPIIVEVASRYPERIEAPALCCCLTGGWAEQPADGPRN